jgi:hypothetical protein
MDNGHCQSFETLLSSDRGHRSQHQNPQNFLLLRLFNLPLNGRTTIMGILALSGSGETLLPDGQGRILLILIRETGCETYERKTTLNYP